MSFSSSLLPILQIDLVGFSRYTSDERLLILELLQKVLKDASGFISPFADFFKKWRRHGTGDGYYLFLDWLSPHTALTLAVKLHHAIATNNRDTPELPIRLRMVLSIGQVQLISDQYHSPALIESARLIDSKLLRNYEQQLWTEAGQSGALATTVAFIVAWRMDETKSELPLEPMTWADFEVIDKHNYTHRGKLWLSSPDVPFSPKP